MIDLSQLTEEQLNELELQIQKHKDDDMLTDDGELDPGIFADYLCDNVVANLIKDFDLYDYEDMSYPIVEIATEEEIKHQF